MSKTVLTGCLARYEIDVRDRDMRMGVPALGVEVHNNVARRVRCYFLRQGIGSVSDDPRRCRIVRVELVLRERLDYHERLVLATRALQHRLDGSNRVIRVTEVRTPRSSTRLLHIRRLAVVRIHNRCRCSHGRRLFRDTHRDNSFTTRSSAAVASSRRATDGAAPAHP